VEGGGECKVGKALMSIPGSATINIIFTLVVLDYISEVWGRSRGGTGARAPLLGHKRSRYPNRAVSNSNTAVAVFIRQCSLSVKL